MRLKDIANKYFTDKRESEHNYVKFYEKHFEGIRNNNLKILEIGIFRPKPESGREVGASLKTWYDYFPNANIYGVDINDFKDVENDRIKTIIADQGFRNTENNVNGLSTIIEKFGGDFDIIIDDGGHTMSQQLVTLGYLFKFLKPNGIFVIEDLHTSYWDKLKNRTTNLYNNTKTKNTTLNVLLEYTKTKKIFSEFITDSETTYLNNNISECIIEKGTYSEICFIKK